MRKDMKDIIIDTVRTAGFEQKSTKQLGNLKRVDDDTLEDLPTSAKQYRTKDLSDRLTPLHRFLCSRVGRLWNDVYKEVCSDNKLGNLRKWHLRTHVNGMVELTTTKVGTKYFHTQRYGGVLQELRDESLFVDEKGILRKYTNSQYTKRYRLRIKEQKPVIAMRISSKECAGFIRGIWYTMPVVFRKDHEKEYILSDSNFELESAYDKKFVGDPFKKKQMNKAQMKKLGLKNSPQE